jgi:6-phosphofructokinase 1
MNAAIRAVVRVATAAGVEVIGVRSGYRGLMGGEYVVLGPRSVAQILTRGGTILGSARPGAFKEPDGRQQALDRMAARGIEGLIVIGGNGSQTGALALHELGVPTVGVASTIDNDLAVFDTCIGVDTALNTALEMIDRLRDTASSHNRCFVVEVMGRQSGYLALMTAIASGASLLMTPEQPIGVEAAEAAIQSAYAAGKTHFIAVVAEGSALKAADLASRLTALDHGNYEVRLSVLGHVQRGGAPTAYDRILATRSAAAAVDALLAGRSGIVAGQVNGAIDVVPQSVAIIPSSKVTEELCTLADILAR